MIETFKVVTGIYDTVVSPTILGVGSSYATRGHDFRLQKIRTRQIYINTISLIEVDQEYYVITMMKLLRTWHFEADIEA